MISKINLMFISSECVNRFRQAFAEKGFFIWLLLTASFIAMYFQYKNLREFKTNYHESKAALEKAEVSTKEQAKKIRELEARLPKAEIQKYKIFLRIEEENQKGLKISVKLQTRNLADTDLRLSAYFYDQNGVPLKDFNQSYYTTNGNVSTWKDFMPNNSNQEYTDLSVFIPYNELHLNAGEYRLKYKIQLTRKSGELITESPSQPLKLSIIE